MLMKHMRCLSIVLVSSCLFALYVIYLNHPEFNLRHVVDSNVAMEYESTNVSEEIKPKLLHSPPQVIFYNRIGKCGSRFLLSIARRLSNDLNYSFAESLDFDRDHPPKEERMKEINLISKLQPPAFYNRHIYFLDFKKYGYVEPIYMNVIRDPIERFSSQYNFLKYGDKESQVSDPRMDLPDINNCVTNVVKLCRTNFMFYIGSYFCGFDPICQNPSEARVNLAKKHVDENYAFIGLAEEFDNTVALLQKMFPDYFLGATDYYSSESAYYGKNTKTNRKEVLTQQSIEKLRNDLMKDEYEVYNHAKQKYITLKEKYGLDVK